MFCIERIILNVADGKKTRRVVHSGVGTVT
jgi:hypothetical protein